MSSHDPTDWSGYAAAERADALGPDLDQYWFECGHDAQPAVCLSCDRCLDCCGCKPHVGQWSDGKTRTNPEAKHE